MVQRYTIQAMIYPGDESGYVAECLNLAVVTQGKTLDETVQNLREAIALHLGARILRSSGGEWNATGRVFRLLGAG